MTRFSQSNFSYKYFCHNYAFHCFQLYFLGLQKIESSPPSCYFYAICLAIVIIDAKCASCGGVPDGQLLLLIFLANVYNGAAPAVFAADKVRTTSFACVYVMLDPSKLNGNNVFLLYSVE